MGIIVNLMMLAMAALLAVAAPHALEDSVVAVVDNSVITQTQLMARTRLVADEMGLTKLTPQQERALAKRTLAGMLDETLVANDAKRRGVSVSAEELARFEASMLEGGMPAARLAEIKQRHGKAWAEKFSADVLWQKIIATQLRPQVNIGQAEIDRTLAEMLQNRQVLEREISQILMKVDSPDEEEAVRGRMQALLEKLQDGEDFATTAKTNSEDDSAKDGGRLGWFANGQLNPALESALDNMQAGTVSNLIRTPAGWHILRLDNVRTTKPIDTAPVKEYELALVGYNGEDNANNNDNIAKLVKKLGKREDIHAWVTVGKDDVRQDLAASAWLGWVKAADLHSAWQGPLESAKVGVWTPRVRAGETTGVLYVAGMRETISPELVKMRERVQQQMFGNRLELTTRNYLRTLRQRAFVDVRL